MDVAVNGYTLLRAIVLVVAVVSLFKLPSRVWPIRVLSLSAMVAFGVCVVLTYSIPYDFKRFWQVGRDLAAGVDYYALNPTGDRQLILNPPTILPLFRLWAMLSLRDAAGIWTALNVVGGMGLVPLAYHAIRAQMGENAPRLPRHQLGLLTAALGMSAGEWMGLALGQVSVLAVAAILTGLWAQGVKRPALAGMALAVATIKVNTLLPFLGLFLRREDRRTWVMLGLTTTALCLATSSPRELPKRFTTTLATIRATFEPGRVNDYSFAGESHVSLVGLDHTLYRLGFRDRDVIRGIQGAVLAGLCLVQGLRLRTRTIDRAEASVSCALIGGIFFYHRIYDEVLMVLPFLYGVLRSASAKSADERRAWSAVGALALMVVYVSPDGLRMLEAASFEMPLFGPYVRGVMLPMASWLILAAMAIPLRTASRRFVPAHGNALQYALMRADKTNVANPRPESNGLVHSARLG